MDTGEELVTCRDYLRNVCKRGRKCKFYHPVIEVAYVFCHDFQNGGCSRVGCKYIHCSKEDEAYYNNTGVLLPHVYDEYQKIINGMKDVTSISKKYHQGANKLEYSNDSVKITEQSDRNSFISDNIWASQDKRSYSQMESACNFPTDIYEDSSCECKRSKRHSSESGMCNNNDSAKDRLLKLVEGRKIWVLESENEMLRQRVSELTKKNSDLQATNEFLLEQNARFRIGDKAAQSLTAVTVPAVTITNTGTLPQAQVNMQQQTMLRTVAASMATVPVSLAAVATATPVSIATVSMAPVQIPPVGTVAQMTHSQEATHRTGNISQETTQLVSYPIINRSATFIQSTLSQH